MFLWVTSGIDVFSSSVLVSVSRAEFCLVPRASIGVSATVT